MRAYVIALLACMTGARHGRRIARGATEADRSADAEPRNSTSATPMGLLSQRHQRDSSSLLELVQSPPSSSEFLGVASLKRLALLVLSFTGCQLTQAFMHPRPVPYLSLSSTTASSRSALSGVSLKGCPMPSLGKPPGHATKAARIPDPGAAGAGGSDRTPAAGRDRAVDNNDWYESGVMIANLGSPEAPTASAVRAFLAQFLHDWRVVDTNRFIWCPILHGYILRTRPAKVAEAYAAIWEPQGSPLITISKKQRDGLANALSSRIGKPVKVVMGMSYGAPSIKGALQELADAGVNDIVVLPMYPQYSSTTTGSTYDSTAMAVRDTRSVPSIKYVHHYYDHPGYINALKNSVLRQWDKTGKPDKLLFSFHGIPVRYKERGDYYDQHCQATAEAVAKALDLSEDEWFLSYQSQFGKEEWLSPKTDVTLKGWGAEGLKHVNVICPGFSADCLETLEEIDGENREYFEEAGGGEYYYIPALNDDDDHIDALASVVLSNMDGCTEEEGCPLEFEAGAPAVTLEERKANALELVGMGWERQRNLFNESWTQHDKALQYIAAKDKSQGERYWEKIDMEWAKVKGDDGMPVNLVIEGEEIQGREVKVKEDANEMQDAN